MKSLYWITRLLLKCTKSLKEFLVRMNLIFRLHFKEHIPQNHNRRKKNEWSQNLWILHMLLSTFNPCLERSMRLIVWTMTDDLWIVQAYLLILMRIILIKNENDIYAHVEIIVETQKIALAQKYNLQPKKRDLSQSKNHMKHCKQVRLLIIWVSMVKCS